jgi:hypothetical protein
LDLAAGEADWTASEIQFAGNDIDESVTVTDTWNGTETRTLGTASSTQTFTYSKVVTVPASLCVSYDNGATFTTNDTGATRSDSKSVMVCGRINGGHTIGFWTNKNGETAFNACPMVNDQTTLGYLVSLNLISKDGKAAFNPTSYTQYKNWLNGSDAVNMSYMLAVQMSATALNVRCGVGGIKMAGDAFVTDPVAGGAITISDLITKANGFLASNPNTSTSGTLRTQAEAYKNTFDSLNNNVVFAVPAP